MVSEASGVVKYFLVDLAGSVIRFPIWWYTSGFAGVAKGLGRELQYRWKSYNFVIWMKNFFVPMYGQHDWSGRLISVFMRLVVLIGRAIGIVVEALVYGMLLMAWLAAPPAFLLLFLLNVAEGSFFNQVQNVLP